MNTVSLNVLTIAICFVATTLGFSDDPEKIDFNSQIKPLLSDRCFLCHGPDESDREAGLRLDLKSGIEEVVDKSDWQESEIWQRISSSDPDERMPPADSNLKLSAAEIDLIQKWLKAGAKWQQHWSFTPLPKKINVPAVKKTDWPINEIDHFVLARLEKAELDPSPKSSREKLIRRLTFDITGLPPTLPEIDAFINDKAPDACEKVIHRLLASPRFGERMASDWLDVARYSDTYGYQVDRDRYVWPWRDWVVNAFNQNKPYNEFLIHQVAGDLLPQATDQQILATTFNRLHPQKVEGGSDPEEFRVEYVADRAQTFSTAFFGLTMECARCHDHKYDPITQKEYYELFAFFDDIDEAGLYSYFTNSVPTPTLRLLTPQQKKQLAALHVQVNKINKQLDDATATDDSGFKSWLQSKPKVEIPKPVKHLDFESAKANGQNKIIQGRAGKALQLSGDDGYGVGVGNFARHQPFTVTLWLKIPDHKERAVIFHRSRAWTDSASRGYQLLLEDGKLSASLIHFWPGNAMRVHTKKVPVNQWIHVAMVYDGTAKASGLKIFVDGKNSTDRIVRDALTKNITGSGGNNITIGQRFRDRGFTGGIVDDLKVFDIDLSELQVAVDHDPSCNDRIGSATNRQLWEHYDLALNAHFKKLKAERTAAYKALHDFENKATEIMVMKQMSKQKNAYVLKRGQYNQRGQGVSAEPIRVLNEAVKFPAYEQKPDERFDRLDLARWATHADHPLTARVQVNRIWQMLFGQGLVRTPEDFGSQGKPPTHPQLLDWLARDYVNNDWDTKRLIRQIVMSATYQQSTNASAKSKQIDPENKLLSHVTRDRLPAEALRDNVLAISGLLNEKIGGPPAKPYEVTASFKPTGKDKGPNLYRRSLYTYWKRTGPAPVMMALDASKRDVCRVQRQRTSSPLQALVLLNDPQVIEACRVLAEKLLEEYGEDSDAIVKKIFRLTTGRPPDQKELSIVSKLLQQQRDYFRANEKAAQDYLSTGDSKSNTKKHKPANIAAVGVVVNTLLNHDECVRKY